MQGLDIKERPISVILSKAKDPGEAGTTWAHQGVLTMPIRVSQECLYALPGQRAAMGSFDSVGDSLREAPAPLRMTGWWRYERSRIFRLHHVQSLWDAVHRYDQQHLPPCPATQEWRKRRLRQQVSLQPSG